MSFCSVNLYGPFQGNPFYLPSALTSQGSLTCMNLIHISPFTSLLDNNLERCGGGANAHNVHFITNSRVRSVPVHKSFNVDVSATHMVPLPGH